MLYDNDELSRYMGMNYSNMGNVKLIYFLEMSLIIIFDN